MEQELYELMAELLDVDSVKDTDLLEDFEDYDSLFIITLITHLDDHYKVLLLSDEVKSCKSIGDLVALIKGKIA